MTSTYASHYYVGFVFNICNHYTTIALLCLECLCSSYTHVLILAFRFAITKKTFAGIVTIIYDSLISLRDYDQDKHIILHML